MINFLKLKGVNIVIKILLLFFVMVNVAVGLYITFLSVFAIENIAGATLSLIGSAGAGYSIMKSVFQIPIAKWLDKQQGEIWDFYILLGAVCCGALYSYFLFFVDQIWEFYAFEIFSGIVDGFMMAAFYAIFSHHIDKESQGFEWSLFSVVGITLAVAVGSFAGGFLADKYGFRILFLLAGTLNIVGALVILILRPHLEIMRKDEHYKTISD